MGITLYRSRLRRGVSRSPVDADEAEKLVPGLGLLLEAAEDAGGDGGGGRLLNAAHDHAQVAGLHDDGDALGLEDLHDGVGDLLGEALLDLKATGEHLGDARELGEADDGIRGDVADVHLRELVSTLGRGLVSGFRN